MEVPVIWTQLLQQGCQHIALGPFVWFGSGNRNDSAANESTYKKIRSQFGFLSAVGLLSCAIRQSVCPNLRVQAGDVSWQPPFTSTVSRDTDETQAHSKQSEAPSDASDGDVTRNASSRKGEQGTRPKFWWHRTPVISIRGFPLSPHVNGRMVPENMPRPLPHPC